MRRNEQLAAGYLRRLEQAWEKTAPLRERLEALAAGAAYDGASDDAPNVSPCFSSSRNSRWRSLGRSTRGLRCTADRALRQFASPSVPQRTG